MPTVIGTQQVSGKIPQNKWYNDLGRITGRVGEKALDALLAAYTAGAAKGGQQHVKPYGSPDPSSPGSLQFPSGASTPISHDELAQLQGYVGGPGSTLAGGVNYVPPPPQTMDQLKYLQGLQDLDPNSPQNYVKTQQANYYSQLPDIMKGSAMAPPIPQSQQPQSFYQSGDIVTRGNKQFKIVGVDASGMPLVEPY